MNANVNAMITSAIWSPDGKRMAYSTMYNARADSTTTVYLRDLLSGEERKLGEFPLIPRKMSWTPDGKAILMPQLTGNSSSVWRYWIDEDRREELAPAEAGDRSAKAFPKLARDGRTLYYLDGPPSLSNCKLIRRDLATGNAKPIATLNVTYDLAPDGEELVIPLLDATSKRMTIQIISNNGQPVRELVQLGPDERVMSLAWAPDGKWIYYGLGTAAGVEIHRVAASGGGIAFTGLRTSSWPDLVVHPNGDQVAFSDTTGSELWKVDGLGSILAKLR